MRDLEFIDEFKRLTPRLEKVFSKAIGLFRGDRAVEVKDLQQETGRAALKNSRLPQYDGYTCERLIFEKAYNVVYEYCHPPLKKMPALPLEEAENQAMNQDPQQDLINRQWLERIYRKVDRRIWIICYLEYEGYKQEEVAAHLGITVGALKMKLSRARERLKRNH
jgi:DNA-directed RNA polymerase specialized sigma24 family protein